jgi:hypothetical protein
MCYKETSRRCSLAAFHSAPVDSLLLKKSFRYQATKRHKLRLNAISVIEHMRFFHFLAIGCALSTSITNPLQAQQVINVQSFEAPTFPPTGWTAVSASINRWGRATNSTFPNVAGAKFGNAFARFSARGVAANTIQTLALPAADYRLRGSNTPSVRFYMYRDSLSKTGDSISVYVNTSARYANCKRLVPLQF